MTVAIQNEKKDKHSPVLRELENVQNLGKRTKIDETIDKLTKIIREVRDKHIPCKTKHENLREIQEKIAYSNYTKHTKQLNQNQ